MKREDYLSWDQYFMGIALLSAERSKDPNTQVGACIVDADNKYFFVCHAELNAILNYSGGSLAGATCYSTLFPCNECAKAIIQSGIKQIVYLSDKYSDTEATIASKMMFQMAGVAIRPYEMGEKDIHLHL